MRRAIFPGSFDPITLGHYDVMKRGTELFDELIIAIGVNSEKKYMFPLEKRIEFIEKAFKDYPNIKVTTYEGLTVDYCKKMDVQFILRGLRNPADFEFEKAIAQANNKLAGVETIFLLTSRETSFVSSSIVREIIKNNGDFSGFVPDCVKL